MLLKFISAAFILLFSSQSAWAATTPNKNEPIMVSADKYGVEIFNFTRANHVEAMAMANNYCRSLGRRAKIKSDDEVHNAVFLHCYRNVTIFQWYNGDYGW